MMKILLILLLVSQLTWAQTVPDYAKEIRWAEQVEEGIMEGDVVWLKANNHEFMSIFTPSESNTQKTAIIVHGLGVHADWSQVVQPLRTALTQQGFNTLSIQMPVLKNGVESEGYAPLFNAVDKRIAAAVEYLQSQDLEPDALIAHSLGSVMSVHYLANNPQAFKRFVGVGMPDMTVKYLAKINIPMLDLYGTKDIQSVLHSVKGRAKAAKLNADYLQMQVDADHFFDEKDALLINKVGAWLK